MRSLCLEARWWAWRCLGMLLNLWLSKGLFAQLVGIRFRTRPGGPDGLIRQLWKFSAEWADKQTWHLRARRIRNRRSVVAVIAAQGSLRATPFGGTIRSYTDGKCVHSPPSGWHLESVSAGRSTARPAAATTPSAAPTR